MEGEKIEIDSIQNIKEEFTEEYNSVWYKMNSDVKIENEDYYTDTKDINITNASKYDLADRTNEEMKVKLENDESLSDLNCEDYNVQSTYNIPNMTCKNDKWSSVNDHLKGTDLLQREDMKVDEILDKQLRQSINETSGLAKKCQESLRDDPLKKQSTNKIENLGLAAGKESRKKKQKKFQCKVCQKGFTHISKLQSHSTMHTGERKHQCNICQKDFSQLSNLKRHILIHTRVKKYQCEICKKSFSRNDSLKIHTIIHTGEKKHQCSICQKAFNWLKNLRSHMIIHTEEEKLQCNICQKDFNRLSHLQRHILIHTRVKKYQCEICKKSFSQNSTLKNHMTIHTGERK